MGLTAYTLCGKVQLPSTCMNANPNPSIVPPAEASDAPRGCGWLRAWTCCTWASGVLLAAAGFLGSPRMLAISAAVLMLLFCPWVLVIARHLEPVTRRPESGDSRALADQCGSTDRPIAPR